MTEAKGIPARTAPTDYQAQGQVGAYTIAAEFTGHGVPTPDAVYNTEDYVVVEVAFYGAKDSRLTLSAEDFTLRINGEKPEKGNKKASKKPPLASVNTELVRRSLKDPNWIPPQVEGGGEKSKTSFGGGGKGDQGSTPPPPPKMPIELQHIMVQRVQKAALLQGDRALPQAGLLFFQFNGKIQKIQSLELIYKGAAGEASIKLQP